MYTFSLTFMLHRSLESRLRNWLGAFVIPFLEKRDDPVPLFSKVVAVPGDPDFASQALSVSMQVSFESPSLLRKWSETAVPFILEDYVAVFGHEAMHFSSVLKSLDL